MKQDIQWWQIIAVCILIAGVILTVWSAQQQDQTMRNDLILKANIANSGISTAQVASLSGTVTDITSPEYRALKTQLEKIRASDPGIRFAYLMGQRTDGTIFFYADSESPESENYSPPGQEYPEASVVLRTLFSNGEKATEGPLSDRWGDWVSGFIPVVNPATGRVIAVYGMDINAQNWNTAIFKVSLPTLIATLLIVLLVLVSAFFQRRSNEHEQGLMLYSAQLSNEITERRRIEDEIRTINQELETRVRDRTKELAETVRNLQDENTERKRVEELIRLANRKLALMNEVSYQDIQNKITALRGFVNISQKSDNEEVRQEYYKKEENTLKTIHNLIKNTKDYQKLGVEKYQWVDMEMVVSRIKLPPDSGVSLSADLHGLFIYSDPQVSRVFELLVDNAVKHGKKTTRISISCRCTTEDITIVYEDDGVGISAGEKDRIFERVVSGEGKFGLFFVKELLNLSGITITETGDPGKGARFEIMVPKGAWRCLIDHHTPRQ
ncbi:MAG: HAMP domain-containing sensor histidine kinase [Methanoregula sp.]|nr:HAMP domain-containing sensor histidine kinase [Methanoregula sp.]